MDSIKDYYVCRSDQNKRKRSIDFYGLRKEGDNKMFGAIVLIVSIIGYIVFKIRCTFYNAQELKEADKKDQNFAFMTDGSVYDRRNHIYGDLTTMINGDRVLKNGLGRVIYNYSAAEREKVKEWLLAHNYVVTTEFIPAEDTCLSRFRNGKYYGEKYKDLKTGEEYILVRKGTDSSWYMSLRTAMWVRASDEVINEELHFLKSYNPDISEEEFEKEKQKHFMPRSEDDERRLNEEQIRLKKLYEMGEISQNSLYHTSQIVSNNNLRCFARDLIN